MAPASPITMPGPCSFLTARDIANELDAPLHRVQYVLRVQSGEIAPVLVASQTRLYSADAVARVRAALKGIAARRASRASDPLSCGLRQLASEEFGDHSGGSEEARDAAPQ